jgi:hypothetical protein
VFLFLDRLAAGAAGAVISPAKLLHVLASRYKEQHQARQQQQQASQQQQQQQRLPKGQLPPDQQAELDNSLRALGLALLRLWQLGCAATTDHLVQAATGEAAAAAAAAAAAGEDAGPTLRRLSELAEVHSCVAQAAEIMLICWPTTEASGGTADTPAAAAAALLTSRGVSR